jgi:DeoR family suf operon transcriptional repressor
MMDGFGERQQGLLKLLLKAKQGLTIDEISEALEITRTAVRQHLSALERMGYLEPGELLATGGRPSQVYRLTPKGYDLFPKQYSWFSEVLVQAIEKEKGPEGLKEWMKQLGHTVASALVEKTRAETLSRRTEKTVGIMNELAYEAQVSSSSESDSSSIEATNCVYHSLAAKHPEVCQFDLALLSKLTQSEVIHEKCILRGENVCRFKLKNGKKE